MFPVWRDDMFRTTLLCLGLIFAVPGLLAEDAPKESVKQDFKKAGKDVESGAKQVGHEVKRGATDVGHGFRDGAKDVGHGVKKAVDPA